MRNTSSILRHASPWPLVASLFACGDSASVATFSVDAGALTAQQDARVPEGPDAQTCESGRVACGEYCVSLDSDPLNCGACGVQCGESLECMDGTCVHFGCDPSEICDGACRDFRSDREHCGACWNTCDADRVCQGGQCLCANGKDTANCQGELCGGERCGDGEYCSRADKCIKDGSCAVDGDCPAQKQCDADSNTCNSESKLTFDKVAKAYKAEVNGIKLAFSPAGPVEGMSCVKLSEPFDKHDNAWKDNFFCSSPDIGLVWEDAGHYCRSRSVRITDPAEPEKHDWADNFLCYNTTKVDLAFLSNATWKTGSISFSDPEDFAWQDNYLTVISRAAPPATPPVVCEPKAHLGSAECGLEGFRAPTFPGGKQANGAEIGQGYARVHSVQESATGAVSAKVTISGRTSQFYRVSATGQCRFAYTGTVGVTSKYDESTKTVTLGGGGTGCMNVPFSWQISLSSERCKTFQSSHASNVQKSLCFKGLKLKVGPDGKTLVLAAPVFP